MRSADHRVAQATPPSASRPRRKGLHEADRAEVEAVVAAHQKMVYGFLRGRMADVAAADDLCQEVFLRFLTSRPLVATGSGETSAWLVGIARNVLREHARRRARRREVSWTELCLDVEHGGNQAAGDTDDRLARIPGCLDGLGKTARAALDLHYGERLRPRPHWAGSVSLNCAKGLATGFILLLLLQPPFLPTELRESVALAPARQRGDPAAPC